MYGYHGSQYAYNLFSLRMRIIHEKSIPTMVLIRSFLSSYIFRNNPDSSVQNFNTNVRFLTRPTALLRSSNYKISDPVWHFFFLQRKNVGTSEVVVLVQRSNRFHFFRFTLVGENSFYWRLRWSVEKFKMHSSNVDSPLSHFCSQCISKLRMRTNLPFFLWYKIWGNDYPSSGIRLQTVSDVDIIIYYAEINVFSRILLMVAWRLRVWSILTYKRDGLFGFFYNTGKFHSYYPF